MTDCDCAHHVDDLAGRAVPLTRAAVASGEFDDTVTIGDLVEWEALDAQEDEELPGRWELWFGDEVRAHYDDDAPLGLESVLAQMDGIGGVVREDRETIQVTAPRRCRDGMLAATALTLLDDRVRLG